MIFVGDGALLWRAVRHARADGHPVDLVCHGPRTTPPPGFTPDEARAVHSGHDLEELAGAYHTWYAACRVIPLGDAPIEPVHASRLMLNQATSQVLRNGLSLLGVGAPEKM